MTDTNGNNMATVAAEHLVGNLYFNLDALPLVASSLSPDVLRMSVGGPAAQAYSEMCRLAHTPGEYLSVGSLEANLRTQGFNFDWLTQLQARIDVESADVLVKYADEVVNLHGLRTLQTVCADAIKSANDGDAKADTITAELMSKLAKPKKQKVETEAIADIGQRVKQRVQDMRDGKVEWGVRTGFNSLDRLFKMRNGNLIMLGGRPSQGKTSLARQIAMYNGADIVAKGVDEQVVFFSADDNPESVLLSMACTRMEVDGKKMEYGGMTDEDWRLIDEGIDYLSSLPIRIDGSSFQTVDQLYYKCAMLNAQKKIRLVMFDYIERISNSHATGDLQKIEAAASGCKGIGNTLGFPWLMLSQLRKETDNSADKLPTTSDLRYAGEAESDVIMLVMRPEHYIAKGEKCNCHAGDEKGVVYISVAKNKTGEIGIVRLAFQKEFTRFGELHR